MSPRFDPLSPEILANPYPAYRELRESAPVHALRQGELYAVAGYEDVAGVLRDDASFSSSIMKEIFLDMESVLRGSADGLELVRRTMDSALPGFSQLMRQRNLIAEDGQEHHGLRALVNRGFTPNRVAALEKTAREVTEACLHDARRRGELELIDTLASPLPGTVIAQLVGVAPERHAEFRSWTNTMIQAVMGASGTFDRELAMPAVVGLVTHLNEVIEARRAEPREDLISTLIRAEDGELALDPSEVMMFVFGLMIAGNETTTNLIGNAVLALLENREQLDAVRAEPERIPALVEEALRYDAPIQALFRRAARDVEFAGMPIPEGATVLALIGSANRDERRFENPDRFDIGREPVGHLAFGFGAHFCLGASLARLEARVALEALLALPDLRRADDTPIERTLSVFLRGPKRIPLRFAGCP